MPSALEDLRLDGLPLNGPGGPVVTNLAINPNAGGSAATVGWTPRAQNNDTVTNLCTNPRAGAGATTGWLAPSLSTFQPVTFDGVTHPAPTDAMRALGLTAGFLCETTDAAGPDIAYQLFSTIAGQPYSVRVFLYLVTNTSGVGGVRPILIDGNGSTTLVAGSSLTTIGQWSEIAAAGVSASTGSGASVQIGDSAGSGTVRWYFTGVMLEKAPVASEFFDGSFLESAWTGTAHASTSTRNNFCQLTIDGAPAFRLRRDVDGSGADTIYIDTPIGASTAGKFLAAAFEIRKHATAGPRNGSLSLYDGAGATITTITVPTADTWQRVLGSGLIASGGSSTMVRARVASALEGETFYVRRVIAAVADTQAAAEAAVNTYFDGSMAGYYWNGAAHNSTSTSSPLFLESVAFPPPAKKQEWQTGADTDGAVLGRTPLYENRTITARVRVEPQADKDTALNAIGLLLDKLQESDRNPTTGIALQWTPADSAKTTTLTVLSGQITNIPISVDGDAGWFVNAPFVDIELTARPFGEGTETILSSSSSTLPLITTELTGIPGDIPAKARLIVTDNATQARRHVEWGAESLNYPTSSPPGLILDSDNLTATGGAQTTRAGSYDPNASGNNVIRGALANQPISVLSTGDQAHVGTYRVKARVYAATSYTDQVQVRLNWQEGDGPFRPNRYATPPVVNNWAEIDLGTITIPKTPTGTQRWTGRVEAFSTVIGDTLDVDYIALIPTEAGYGVARSAYAYQPGTLVARDEFTSTTSGGALNGRVAPLGGTWATTGATTDFAFIDVGATGEALGRSTVSDASGRFAALGSTNYTDVEVGVTASITSGLQLVGVVARYTDANNHFRVAAFCAPQFPGTTSLSIQTVIGGTVVNLVPQYAPGLPLAFKLRVVVYATGHGVASVLTTSGGPLYDVPFFSTALATGGALATGKPGIYDFAQGAGTRTYDDFYAATPAAEPIVVHSGRTIEFRSDSTLRQDSTGAMVGPPPTYKGARFTVPPAGTRGRKTRVAVKARRADVAVNADEQIADSTTVQIAYTPRYLVIPR